MSELTVLLTDGSTRPWSLVRQAAKDVNLTFEVLGSNTGITFYLGPDIFPDSYRLAWMTPEARSPGTVIGSRRLPVANRTSGFRLRGALRSEVLMPLKASSLRRA
jgi:hypothetical protein